ncbi:RAD26-like SNF2 family DNA-dependent ATPase [Mycena kentingensis (nom. inval.)]|nr:RAD26-like SNF2 family DNA-dependent ATPase [Mycena kentingensis (nom. inval.)]
MAPSGKVSAYAKRHSNSIAAPIDNDSDSDFNAGPIEQEEPKKKKRKSGPKTTKSGSSTRRRAIAGSDSDTDEDAQPARKRRKINATKAKARRKGDPSPHNPLREFFKDSDNDDSTDEEVGAAEADVEDHEHMEVDDEDEDDHHREPVKHDAFSKYKRKPTPPSSGPAEAVDDSATEDESDEDAVPVKPKPQEDSATESESETESESDYDGPPLKGSEPRPDFALEPGQKRLGAFVLDEEKRIKVPSAINTYLRPYQREGIQFFYERYKKGMGALLGDDMGLGKTIQIISFLSAIMGKTGTKVDRKRRRKHVLALQDGREWKKNRTLPPANATWPTCLIIAPTSVTGNWDRELEKWGYFEAELYMGPNRADVLKEFKMGKLDILITTHDTARLDIQLLDDLPFSCIIVDEVHNVKNERSQTTMAYHQFECQIRIGLTGTAIQNNYTELHTILDWTNPGKLGTIKEWKHYVSKPLTCGQSTTATEMEKYRGERVAKILNEKVLPLYFLRRTKALIADQMPKKIDQVVFCPLAPKQIAVYRKILAHSEVEAVLRRAEDCECGSQKQRSKCCFPYHKGTIFRFLSILLKLSNHLGLILPGTNDTHEQLERNRESAAMAFPNGDAPSFEMAIMDPKLCGKWQVLMSLLTAWKKHKAEKNKVLIFTKSVKLLEMMKFQLEFESINFLVLEGSVKAKDRMPLVDRFQTEDDIFVFLISTMAGGTGLNLTVANKVVIFDPNWNPAHDLQAMDRQALSPCCNTTTDPLSSAFRMGQQRDVHVYRLLGAGCVEELIYARQLYKQQQMEIGYKASIQTRYFEGVQGDKSKQGELFGLDNIFRLDEKRMTQQAIENAHIAELDWKLNNRDTSKSKSKQAQAFESMAKGDELGGLGDLLFSDELPTTKSTAERAAEAAMAGMYKHHNPDLLQPSKVEEQKAKERNARMRSTKRRNTTKNSGPAEVWPPIRTHIKKPAVKPIVLKDHIRAMVDLGIISNAGQLASFAAGFNKWTPEQQDETAKMIRDWKPDSSDEEEDDSSVGIAEPEEVIRILKKNRLYIFLFPQPANLFERRVLYLKIDIGVFVFCSTPPPRSLEARAMPPRQPTALLALALLILPALAAPSSNNDQFKAIAAQVVKPPAPPICCLVPSASSEPSDDILLSFEEWKEKERKRVDKWAAEKSVSGDGEATGSGSESETMEQTQEVPPSSPVVSETPLVARTAPEDDAEPPHFRVPITDRFNYASLDCSARVHTSHRTSKSATSILSYKRDKYMLSPCRDKQFVVVELCDDIRIDTVQLANFEFFSGVFKDFTVSVAKTYTTDPEGWTFAGRYTAKNIRVVQSFHPPTTLRDFYRFIRIDFASHYGNEYYCPVSLLRVYGLTHLEEYKWDVWREESQARSKVASVSTAASPPLEVNEPEPAPAPEIRIPLSYAEFIVASAEASAATKGQPNIVHPDTATSLQSPSSLDDELPSMSTSANSDLKDSSSASESSSLSMEPGSPDPPSLTLVVSAAHTSDGTSEAIHIENESGTANTLSGSILASPIETISATTITYIVSDISSSDNDLPAASLSSTASSSPSHPASAPTTNSNSIYRTIMNRLSALEANHTIFAASTNATAICDFNRPGFECIRCGAVIPVTALPLTSADGLVVGILVAWIVLPKV